MNTITRAVILVIDDDQAVRQSIGNYLEDFGYTVLQAEDGQVGLEMFRTHAPDIILVDLRMPRLDGLQVLDRVRAESPKTPAIVISGVVESVADSLRKWACDYLAKPIQDMTSLIEAIEACLERARR